MVVAHMSSPQPVCLRAWRAPPVQRARSARQVARGSNLSSQPTRELLDRFWLAQGVVDDAQRRQLVDAADQVPEEGELEAEGLGGGSEWGPGQPLLPGVSATWAAAEAGPQVRALSRRLLALRQALGGGSGAEGADVVWMMVREPRLLTADLRSILRRLLDMRLAEGSVDVVALVEAQPALLLADACSSSSGSEGEEGEEEEEESAASRLLAWQHGLVSDSRAEWGRRLGQLAAYAAAAGHAHVGYRDEDDAELGRWASKQRAVHKSGELAPAQEAKLRALGFEFNDELAEWLRNYVEMRAYTGRHGSCSPVPLASGSDFLLHNWCAIQRIAMRSRVLSQERIALLDELPGWDWTGADALS